MSKFFWLGFILATAIVCGLTRNADAGELGLAYGANPPWQGIHAKILRIDYALPLYRALWLKTGAAYWFEAGDGASGGLVSESLGTRVESHDFFAELYWGVAYATNPDSYWLTGHLQFTNDVGFGLTHQGVDVGAWYKHISNAGIEQPNRGRDFLLLGVCYSI